MARNYHQGYYEPKNPEKCLNAGKITYRSSWEKVFFEYADRNPKVLKWGSESVVVPYENPVKGRMARYFVDVIMTYVDRDGKEKTVLIEIKPENQCKTPKKGRNQKQSTFDEQQLTYIQNVSKWTAAQKYAAERGWEFRILTENQLFR